MKKLLTVSAIVILSLALTLNLAACGGREKFDFSSVNSIADLGGAVIGAQTGTFHLDALKGQTEGVEVKEYEDFTQLLTALNMGVIDGYVAEEPTAFAVIAQDPNLTYLHLKNNDTGFTASPSDTGIAVAFATGSEYVWQVNDVIAGISDDTRSALMMQAVALSADPDTEVGSPVLVSTNEVPSGAPVLKIAMECAYAPFNWSQTTSANGAVKIANAGNPFYANGYDVQIAKYIAAELGMQLEIYAEDWESLITGVQAGTYTGIIAGMSPTAEREEEVDFTECYYNSDLVIIYKK